jgi:glycosyltransferase involved in cell wall biosynthesis
MLNRPSIKIIATILARNEADIIAQNIEHHLEQGVWKILFTDNNSDDETLKIASNYPEVEIIQEMGNDHNQSQWVTRMAQEACKWSPDWIIHLDADEFCVDLWALREMGPVVVGCELMHMHPPNNGSMEYYLDLEHIPIPQECKVAHRPIKDIVITHGNHGVMGDYKTIYTKKITRHHFPVRSFEQWKRKAIEGHAALKRRNSLCKRWERWAQIIEQGRGQEAYNNIIQTWQDLISGQSANFIPLLEYWCEPEIVGLFNSNPHWIPKIKAYKVF